MGAPSYLLDTGVALLLARGSDHGQAARAPLLTTDKDFEHLNPGWIELEYCDPSKLG